MKNNDRGRRPYVPPVRRIELPVVNEKLRWIAIVVLLSIGVVSIGKGLYSLVSVQPGWQTVEVASREPNCSLEFSLQYDFTDAGSGASVEMKRINETYTRATEEAYRIFSAEAEETDNVRALNEHVNEDIRLSPTLYEALSLFDEKTVSYLFLAPAMIEYNRVFISEDDAEASRYDPSQVEETAQWLRELTAFTANPDHISLELLEDNWARLNVSAAYLDFAEENEIETFLDFGWMKNAFIADYLAQVLTDNGFTNGYLVSYDGFTRNMDSRGHDYAVNLFDHHGGALYLPGVFHYSQPMSLVHLRDYPVSDQDRWHYYTYETGKTVTAFLDPADGMSKPGIGNLLGYSASKGCAQILMELLPVFVASEFNPQPLEAAAGEGIYALWCDGGAVCHTEDQANLEITPDSGYHVK